MNKSVLSAILIGALGVSGCAKKSDQISASYVSPLTYQNYTCSQLREEAVRISARVSSSMGEQNRKAHNDAVATGVAVVLFWPAAFFIKGDQGSAAELGRLKGEMDAIERASIARRCGITFQTEKVPANSKTTKAAD